MDIGAVLDTKLHEHILGPVIPQGPGLLPAEELRWGFIGVGEGRLRALGKDGRREDMGIFYAAALSKWSQMKQEEVEGVMGMGVCGEGESGENQKHGSRGGPG